MFLFFVYRSTSIGTVCILYQRRRVDWTAYGDGRKTLLPVHSRPSYREQTTQKGDMIIMMKGQSLEGRYFSS
jgi:hypothetical protein